MITIRFMKREDCKAVAALEEEIFSCPWSEQSFLDVLEKKDIFYLIAEQEQEKEIEIEMQMQIRIKAENRKIKSQKLIGYIGVWQSFEEADITNVAVIQKERGKGVGCLLLEKAIEEARHRGIAALALEVRESNQAAIRLYQKFGFLVEGVRPNYYEKPRENALLMWNRSLRGITIEKQKNYPV